MATKVKRRSSPKKKDDNTVLFLLAGLGLALWWYNSKKNEPSVPPVTTVPSVEEPTPSQPIPPSTATPGILPSQTFPVVDTTELWVKSQKNNDNLFTPNSYV